MTPTPPATIGFVGVSTGESSIRRVFPRWAHALDLPAVLTGHDLPPEASASQYRAVVSALRDDRQCAGALITTHKIGVFQYARDMFDELDHFAEMCGEISSVSKRDGRLIGHAKDPITAGLSLEELISSRHFTETGGHVLCLGAGGAGTAIAWYLTQRADSPRRFLCTDRRRERLDSLVGALRRAGIDSSRVRTELTPGSADHLFEDLPEGSVVINATGLGKDAPGSPITDAAKWPRGAIAWELNYRGSLEFLHQAKAAPGLRVIDGWRYFIHGWTQVIAEIFGLHLTPEKVEELADIAEAVR